MFKHIHKNIMYCYDSIKTLNNNNNNNTALMTHTLNRCEIEREGSMLALPATRFPTTRWCHVKHSGSLMKSIGTLAAPGGFENVIRAGAILGSLQYVIPL